MRAAIAALPFETPRLSLNANVESKDFAERLEGAIKRSGVRPLVIEHSSVQAPRESPEPTDLAKPMCCQLSGKAEGSSPCEVCLYPKGYSPAVEARS